MKQIVLDTNFIINCIKNKIDFFGQLGLDYKILIPKQVIAELKRIDKSGLALKILQKNKFKKIDLKINYVDKGLVRFAKQNPDVVVATLDRVLKDKIKNEKLGIRGKKRLKII